MHDQALFLLSYFPLGFTLTYHFCLLLFLEFAITGYGWPDSSCSIYSVCFFETREKGGGLLECKGWVGGGGGGGGNFAPRTRGIEFHDFLIRDALHVALSLYSRLGL